MSDAFLFYATNKHLLFFFFFSVMCVYFCECTQHSAHEPDDSLQESVLSYHASGIELRSYVGFRPALHMYMHLCIYKHVHKHQHTFLLKHLTGPCSMSNSGTLLQFQGPQPVALMCGGSFKR